MTEAAKRAHGKVVLLASYNRQCPDCRRALGEISEKRARVWLAEEAARSPVSRIRLQNAIAIWQSASKRVSKGERP